MDIQDRGQQIKSIIKLEDRIAQCRRCPVLIRCTSKPSLGKGDLEPQALLVFECESYQTRDIKWIIELRNMIRQYFQLERVYYTFMVRCHPKACVINQGNTCCLTHKLEKHNGICLLNDQHCDGILIKPTNEEIINCLYFLLEEIEILQPQYVILFGSRVEDFVLKSYGIFDPGNHYQVHHYETTTLLTIPENKEYEADDIKRLAVLANISG
jgi:uracil-DNA glycosylase